ncbi:hypothetical protein PIN31009_05555 [Pandoraea iniqua]|uniref:hypothetical protein n=1 Tax=Pandoraea iniqua TaxID=2508288 RepID=UPI00123F0722|nr:hypothetical protein [Pandoraea iniqua]VVE59489.1 hypothetical protein PIN31009_05555 [Pandoraea iniqua]
MDEHKEALYAVWMDSGGQFAVHVDGKPSVCSLTGHLIFTRADGVVTSRFQVWFGFRIQDKE